MNVARVVFICQTVDADDMLLANVVRWIAVLAGKPAVERVHVICLRAGRAELPPNVTLHVIGAGRRPATLYRFYSVVLSLLRRREVDFFFVHMGGVYPILLAPLKLLARKRVYQWKAHPHIDWVMRLSLLVDDRVFTATPSSFPRRSPKVRVTGHGIDVRRFAPRPAHDAGRALVTVGRISARKRIHEMVTALHAHARLHGDTPRLRIVGASATARDRRYSSELRDLIARLGLDDRVEFLGARSQEEIARIVPGCAAFLGFSGTALDKATLEAMALGVPVVSTNPCFAEILPEWLRSLLVAREGDAENQADHIHRVLALDAAGRARVGEALREVVEHEHSDEVLFDRILAEIGAAGRQ